MRENGLGMARPVRWGEYQHLTLPPQESASSFPSLKGKTSAGVCLIPFTAACQALAPAHMAMVLGEH